MQPEPPYATLDAIECYFHGSAAENVRALITSALSTANRASDQQRKSA